MNYLFSIFLCAIMTCASIGFSLEDTMLEQPSTTPVVMDFNGKRLIFEDIQKVLDVQTELEELAMRQVYILEPHLATLLFAGSFPRLKVLNFSNSFMFIQNTFPDLRNLFQRFSPNLERLHLSSAFHYELVHRGCEDIFSSIASLKNLEYLDISNNSWPHFLNQYMVDQLSLLPKLKELSVAGTRSVTQLDFSNLQSLEKLNLRDGGVNWYMDMFVPLATFSNLARLSNLKSLNLGNHYFIPEEIELTQYTTLTNLEELFLDAANFKGAQLSVFAPNLKWLSMESSNITGGDIAQIALLKNLEILNIGNTSITGSSIKKLGSLPHLKELSLAGTNMTKADFTVLPPSLEILNLYGSALSIASFNSLYALTHLKKLYLSRNRNGNITPAMIQQLKETLTGCKVME